MVKNCQNGQNGQTGQKRSKMIKNAKYIKFSTGACRLVVLMGFKWVIPFLWQYLV